MENPGIQSLGDIAITTAGTFTTGWVSGFDGALALNAQLYLQFGSGGTSVTVYLQTSLDQGTTAIDIGCFLFGTATKRDVVNFSALTPKTTELNPTDGGLANDTFIDGVLGDRFRLKYVVVGTYALSTVLSGRLCAR